MSVMVKCDGLTKRYGRLTALDNVNLSIESGRIVGLLGPNGSGKTTLLKLANGLLVPSDGEILLDGNKPGVESKRIVSYLPDANYLPDWMAIEGLLELFQDFYEDFDVVKAKELILAMSRKAKIYFLDEPIGGVDPAARDFILNTIIKNYSEDAAVVISTHLIADIERILDEVVFINQGQLVSHRIVDEIRETEGKSVDALFREVFRC